MSAHAGALARVLDAAERRAREILDQASVYERKGMQPIADETLNEHYRPLRNAIDTLRGDVVILSRETVERAAERLDVSRRTAPQPDVNEALARALRGYGDAAARMPDATGARPAPAADALAIARTAVPGGHVPDRYRGDAFVTETNSALWALNREREWITARCEAHGHPAAADEDGDARCWCGARHGRLSPPPAKRIDVEITLPQALLEQLRAGRRDAVRQLTREIEHHGVGCTLVLRPLETKR